MADVNDDQWHHHQWSDGEHHVDGEPCVDCDDNPEHGSNTDAEMDVDDNDPTAP